MNSVLQILKDRELIAQISNEDALKELLNTRQISMYVGFDPSAQSLHVGHLLPIMVMAHFQRAGHRPIALVGGATGMIGDPSGRSAERNLLTPDKVKENVDSLKKQLQSFIDFQGEHAALMVDNQDWIGPMSYLDWLRDVGKFFSVNYMMSKESVRRRLEDREQGISYTEFSYMLLQAYDFLHLFREQDCLIQGGGNDQWGNITAGIDLIHKTMGQSAYGITFPLVTTANGEKFGKSAGNAVWLAPELTSPYVFFQFWIQTDDRDVERYLKFFTFLELDEIATICEQHQQQPENRWAQRRLAEEMTRIVHGDAAVQQAIKASEILFGQPIEEVDEMTLRAIFQDVPATRLNHSALDNGLNLLELLRLTGLAASNGEARRLIQGGGIYVNNQQVQEPNLKISKALLASENLLVLRSGKKNYHLIEFSV